jgi:lysophospholipase L1-like esterase
MPLTINTVVVFGDSLSDIGKKWVTKSGKMARWTKQMYVSPTGRFSDCRNWTDFMFETASGFTLVGGSADDAIAVSKRHQSLSANSTAPNSGFQYANYAEGGACGDTPASKAAFLGTFKDQVDAFEKDCVSSNLPLGATLFIIWFGANDLYTAGRPAEQMGVVAAQIAGTQRNRLNQIIRSRNGTAKFIFVDLARPLSSVRYSMRLKQAELELKKIGADPSELQLSNLKGGGMWQAKQTLETASPKQSKSKEYLLLKKQFDEIKNLEQGVLNFNTQLAITARLNGDRVAEIGSCLSEETIRGLIRGNYGLKAGAMTVEAKYQSTTDYVQSTGSAHLTTIDGVHPTDQMYKLIWFEIYEEIKRSDCTFGTLALQGAESPLSTLSGPTQQTRAAFQNVMRELRGG